MAEEKTFSLFDRLSAMKNQDREDEIMPKELQDMLERAEQESGSFRRMTEEMRSRIAQ